MSGTIHVNRIRLAGTAVSAAIADARAVATDADASTVIWWVGDRATPESLGQELAARGLAHLQRLTGLTLAREPTGEAALAARPCSSLDQFTAAQELDWSVTALAEEKRARLRERLAEQWEREGRFGRTFVVEERGEVISAGRAHFGPDAVFLTGGATAPHARRRGAYTSLVHARWHEALARGTPLLVTQASDASRPILARLGFDAVGTIDLYRDTI